MPVLVFEAEYIIRGFAECLCKQYYGIGAGLFESVFPVGNRGMTVTYNGSELLLR